MPKGKLQKDREPSNRVHDTFREKSFGLVNAPVNSKPGFDSFFVDPSRLGVHSEWDNDAPNEWGGKGRTVEVSNNVRLNAIAGMGDLRFKASNKSPDHDKDTGAGPCCDPVPYAPYSGSGNPMYRKRKE